MGSPNSSENATIPGTITTLAATSPTSPKDQELDDWNAFYQLLLAGKVSRYGGHFIAIYGGNVVGFGSDPDELRRRTAPQLDIAAEQLVVPFVDDKECIANE